MTKPTIDQLQTWEQLFITAYDADPMGITALMTRQTVGSITTRSLTRKLLVRLYGKQYPLATLHATTDRLVKTLDSDCVI